MIVFQPFKYMYSQLRRKNADLQLICEVFDRVELNFEVAQQNTVATPEPITLVFPTLSVGVTTTYIYLFDAFTPTRAAITAEVASTVGAVSINVQQSVDAVNWSTIINIQLGKNNLVFNKPVTVAAIPIGQLLRGQVDAASSVDATGVNVIIR